jgi:hypothetical protein
MDHPGRLGERGPWVPPDARPLTVVFCAAEEARGALHSIPNEGAPPTRGQPRGIPCGHPEGRGTII